MWAALVGGCVTTPADPDPHAHQHSHEAGPAEPANGGVTVISEFAPPRCDGIQRLDQCTRGFGFARCPGGDDAQVQLGCAAGVEGEGGECLWFWGCAPASHAAPCQCAHTTCAHFVSLFGRAPWDERRALNLAIQPADRPPDDATVDCEGCDGECPVTPSLRAVGDAAFRGVELSGLPERQRLLIEHDGERARICLVKLVDHVDFHCHYREPECADDGALTLTADGQHGRAEIDIGGRRFSVAF